MRPRYKRWNYSGILCFTVYIYNSPCNECNGIDWAGGDQTPPEGGRGALLGGPRRLLLDWGLRASRGIRRPPERGRLNFWGSEGPQSRVESFPLGVRRAPRERVRELLQGGRGGEKESEGLQRRSRAFAGSEDPHKVSRRPPRGGLSTPSVVQEPPEGGRGPFRGVRGPPEAVRGPQRGVEGLLGVRGPPEGGQGPFWGSKIRSDSSL